MPDDAAVVRFMDGTSWTMPAIGISIGPTLGLRGFHLTAESTEGHLVTAGPYLAIRHPIYTAVCLFI